MAFATGHLDDIQAAGGGERVGPTGVVLSFTDFEDNLKSGRFAKLDSGSLDNMDGSSAPVIAGVVLRNVAGAVEDGAAYDDALYRQVDAIRQGLCTVDVKTGETPARFGRVHVSNAGDANDGLALASGGIAIEGEYIQEVKSGVWLIWLRLPANELPAIIADPGNAGAIDNTRSGVVAITTAGAETRTLAAPSFAGQTLDISLDVDGGDAVITVTPAINQVGNNTATMADAGDHLSLVAVQVAGALVWRIIANDGAALTTV